MKKTYPDQCLERSEKATEGPWVTNGGSAIIATDVCGQFGISSIRKKKPKRKQDFTFIAHARTDVPELARRLKKACDALKDAYNLQLHPSNLQDIADELESPLEDK